MSPRRSKPADRPDPQRSTPTTPTRNPPTGLREHRKAQTRRSIQEHALHLFLAKGYDATTVAEIAAAAGVSHMTFFRYFPSKEAVVENDEYDRMLVGLIRGRPTTEPPLTALRAAIGEGLGRIYATDHDAILVRTRLILQTPALRARMATNQHATQQLFAETLAARRGTDVDLGLRVVAAAALAALSTALTTWVESEGADDLPDLIDQSFEALSKLTS